MTKADIVAKISEKLGLEKGDVKQQWRPLWRK